MVCADSELFYAAECPQKVSFQVEKDGYGLKGRNLQMVNLYLLAGVRSTA